MTLLVNNVRSEWGNFLETWILELLKGTPGVFQRNSTTRPLSTQQQQQQRGSGQCPNTLLPLRSQQPLCVTSSSGPMTSTPRDRDPPYLDITSPVNIGTTAPAACIKPIARGGSDNLTVGPQLDVSTTRPTSPSCIPNHLSSPSLAPVNPSIDPDKIEIEFQSRYFTSRQIRNHGNLEGREREEEREGERERGGGFGGSKIQREGKRVPSITICLQHLKFAYSPHAFTGFSLYVCLIVQSDPDLVTSTGERVLVTKSGWALNRGQIPLY
eukprot:sb/3468192/